MLEICAVVLTLGAVFYHNLGFDLFTVSLFGVSLIFFLYFSFRSRVGIIFSLVIGGGFILGALAMWNSDRIIPREVFGSRAFDAKVIAIDRRLSKTNIIIKDMDHDTNLQVSLFEDSDLLPGDMISVRANVGMPESFLTDQGRLFDYPRYLESKGIVGVAQNANILLQKEGGVSISRIATELRFGIADIFKKYITFPIDGIVAGMTVGYQGGLPKEVQDLFRNTGVLHVLVLSGYNITLLAGFLAMLLRAFPFRVRTGLTILAIVMLVVISGSGVASIRAGIMGSIALFAGLATRTYQPLRALALAYLIFFFVSPQTIFADPGFHLSFLATGFIILVLPQVERLFSFLPKTRGIDIKEILILAMTIPFFMLPYMMYFSGSFPLVSPITNIFLSILTPLLMISGISLIVFSWLGPVAHIIGTLISALGNVVTWLLEVFAKLPLWRTPQLPWWAVVVFYLIFIYFLFRKEIRLYFLHLQNLFLPASNSSDS